MQTNNVLLTYPRSEISNSIQSNTTQYADYLKAWLCHVGFESPVVIRVMSHPLLKTTLTGLRRTYLRFLVFRPKLTKTKRFPPFLDHMNGKLFLGGSRFWSGKIGPKLALGGHRSQCPAELSFFFNRCPAGNPLFLTDKIYF